MPHPEAPILIRILLAAHILAGTVALFAAPVALAVVKGGRTHRRFGKIYVFAMAVVATTALIIAPYFQSWFLLFIAVFSFFLAFSGRRVLRLKRGIDRPEAIDWIAASLSILAGIGLALLAYLQRAHYGTFTIALSLFALIAIGSGALSMRRFLTPPKVSGTWKVDHLQLMMGAYIATVTAFSAVNFTFLNPPVVRWLWPTAAGALAITILRRRYAKRQDVIVTSRAVGTGKA
jgi:uncharacterized membrane protein